MTLGKSMNLRDAISYARQLGATVEPVHRTGELCFSHPRARQRVRVCGRRKDTPRVVISWLRHLEADR